MTRLFLRFYLGVIAILFSAWLIQSYVVRERSSAQNVRVVEEALGGGARLARARLSAAPPEQFQQTLEEIQSQFDYPVQVFRLSDDWVTAPIRERIVNGEVVLLGGYIAVGLPPGDAGITADDASEVDDSRLGLIMGPLPEFVGPSQAEILLGFGIVFLLTAIAIAVLLRPVASQLRAVERTADAIAHGDLSARIDSSQAPRGLTLVRAFNTMADRTETSLRSQRELLQAVSHELRTPLARIRFAIDLVESAKNDEERHTRLKAIDDATQKLDDLVGELLTYVRLDADTPQDSLESFDLQALVDELVEIHAPLYASVRYEVEPAAGATAVTADRSSIARAIENLISNAGRHAREHVVIRAFRQDQGIVIQVDDDGAGVDPEERSKIFEPFVRLENESDRGAGLGLALVHRIAKRHGGRIEVDESPTGGARFSLYIPVGSPSSDE